MPSEKWNIRSLSVMDVGGTLGAGTFGVVFMANDVNDGNTKVALKKIKMERETQGFPVTAIREIKILKALKHENIVNLREIVVFNEDEDREQFKSHSEFSHGDVFMVFEYVDYDLYGLLKSSGVALTEAHIRSFTSQLLEGVHFLHKNMILHRDIKSANILIGKNNVLKLADWGLARYYQKTNARMSNPVVTLWYRSPELLCGTRKYGAEVDMWSVGCIFGEMKTRKPILAVKENTESEVKQMELLWKECGTNISPDVLKKYEEYPNWDKFKFHTSSQRRISNKFEGERGWDTHSLSLLERLLDWDPETRINASDALSHEYFYAGQGIVPPERLAVFGHVECPRQSDVVQKHKDEHDKAVEAQKRAEARKREAAAAAETATKSATASGSAKRRFGQMEQGGSSGKAGAKKYKIVRKAQSSLSASALSPAGSAAAKATVDAAAAAAAADQIAVVKKEVKKEAPGGPAPQSLTVGSLSSLQRDGFF